jgi:uncharacterized membrane protein YgcG
MKKRLFSLLLCLLIAVILASPAFGAYEYGKYYDETEELWTENLQVIGEDTLTAVSDTLNFDIRLDVFTSLSEDGMEATAEYVFENYYGADTDGNGVSLSVYVLEDSTGWDLEQWYIYVADNGGDWDGLDDYLYDYVSDGFTEAAWAGSLQQDCQTVELIGGLLAAGVAQFATEDSSQSNAAVDFMAEGNVIDLVGVLTEGQDAALEAIIDSFDDAYLCGCYAVVTDNFAQFGETPPDAVINLYHGNDLGLGDGRDGILLMVDVVNRKFAFFVYGDNAEYIFDAYGQEELEKVFVDDLGEDLWYDALEDYARECGAYMDLAAEGNPVRESKTGGYMLAIFAALLIAGAVTFVLLSQMKSVYKGAEATEYVTEGGLRLTERSDIFMYKTTVTRDLSSDDDDSSSSSFSGGGGSGRSGSF